MRNLVIILDPAHGEDVLGKSSPDGKHREYRWSREVCNILAKELRSNEFRVEFTNTFINEIGLSKRKNFASNLEIRNNQVKLLLSLHNNAAGDGSEWLSARGFEIFTSKGNTVSDRMATIIFNNLIEDFPNFKARVDYSDGDPDKEDNFTVLMGDYYAVLLEWLFQDNKEDVKLLQFEPVNEDLVKSLVNSLIYIDDNLDVIR